MLATFSVVKEVRIREQRDQAVRAVIADARVVGEVAAQYGVSKRSVPTCLRRDKDHDLNRLVYQPDEPRMIPIYD